MRTGALAVTVSTPRRDSASMVSRCALPTVTMPTAALGAGQVSLSMLWRRANAATAFMRRFMRASTASDRKSRAEYSSDSGGRSGSAGMS
ncbi:hypothetical protein D3C85_1096360 [compost metagenome]